MSNLPEFILNPDPEVYLNGSFVTLDFETTNIDHGSPYEPKNFLLLACWKLSDNHPNAGEGGLVRSHWGSEYEQSELLEDIARADFLVAHFTKFELGWLARCGLDLRRVLPYCTQIGEYVLAGNRKFAGGLGLDATASRYGLRGKLRFVASLIENGVCPSDIPQRALQDYCVQDIETTEGIFLQQRRLLGDFGLLPTAYSRNIVTPVLVDIESRGMCLDPERVNAAFADYSARYNALLTDFAQVTGGINPRSGKQMREYLYEKLKFAEVTDHKGNPLRTGGGKKGLPQPRTDKKVLPLLKAETDEQKQFKKLAIEIAKLKVPVQNLTKMKAITDKGETLVYASINQTVTDTHRFSSSGRRGGFQFHNFDRAFKYLFRARPAGGGGDVDLHGRLVVEADAPQLEFRVAGHLGDDPVARRAVVDGEDVHAFTASVLGCSRQNAKAFTFKPLYGGNSGTAKEKAYYKAFREKYKAIYKTQKGWTLQVARDKFLTTATGLRFYWPDTKISQDGYISNTPSIFNYPVQSLATADIIPLTLVLVWHRIAELDDCFLVNTIHDSIIAECSTFQVDRYVDILIKSFTQDCYWLLEKLYGIRFSLPLGVGIKAGSHWGAGEEQKFEPKGFRHE